MKLKRSCICTAYFGNDELLHVRWFDQTEDETSDLGSFITVLHDLSDFGVISVVSEGNVNVVVYLIERVSSDEEEL